MKPNKILVGIILVLVGVFSLLRNYIPFNFGMLMMLVTGLALLLLYRQKKAVWSLFAGAYLTYFGALQFLGWVGIRLGGHVFVGMFFIVPGIIFMVLYLEKKKRGLLIPSCVLLCLGAFITISGGIFRMLRMIPYAIIIMGVMMILKSILNKPRN